MICHWFADAPMSPMLSQPHMNKLERKSLPPCLFCFLTKVCLIRSRVSQELTQILYLTMSHPLSTCSLSNTLQSDCAKSLSGILWTNQVTTLPQMQCFLSYQNYIIWASACKTKLWWVFIIQCGGVDELLGLEPRHLGSNLHSAMRKSLEEQQW